MSAVFPTSIKTFVDKVDYRDTVLADHMNSLQDEVTAIERTLGTRVLRSNGYTGTFDTTTTVWDPYAGGLSARLQNIEYGLRADSHVQYINKSAGTDNVITPNAADIVGLTISPANGQTADLLSANGARVTSDGRVYSGGRQVATTNGQETLTGKVMSGIENTFSDIPATAVVSGGQAIQTILDGLPRTILSPVEPDTTDLPIGSLWIHSDVDVETFGDIKDQLKTMAAAAADFDEFKAALAVW